MKNIGLVHGSAEQAKPLVIGKDTVYVHNNIRPATRKQRVEEGIKEVEVEGLYAYEEIQYGKDEYLALMIAKNDQMAQELTETQLALCELYEAIGGVE